MRVEPQNQLRTIPEFISSHLVIELSSGLKIEMTEEAGGLLVRGIMDSGRGIDIKPQANNAVKIVSAKE